jgi:hypothetical protein
MLQPHFYALDVCTKTKVIPMPAGVVMNMVKKMAQDKNLPGPVTMEQLVRERNRYFNKAIIFN